MGDATEDPGPILTGAVEGDAIEPECQIRGCERPGAVPRKMSAQGGDDQAREEFVCRYHHRTLLAMKVGIVVVALAVLIGAIYVSM